jgi:hypothetical protein
VLAPKIPGAQELTSEQLLQPVLVAVQDNEQCTQQLCGLPAPASIEAEALAQLLQAALSGNNSMACIDSRMTS